MILGVTGSRIDRPLRLISKLTKFMASHGVTELHHGDCVGWDKQCHVAACIMGIRCVVHPPDDETYRAFSMTADKHPPKPYLDRNRDIVDAVDYLIAAPDGPERQRSGTWSTVRYAKKVGVNGVVWM